MSSIHDLWIYALFSSGAGFYLFFNGFRVLQRKRLIQNTPASKIRSASMGLVEVSGLAVGPGTIQAPITGLPCYYYRTLAWQLSQSSRNRDWKQVADETRHVPFYLDDNTGTVLVNPQGAELDLHRDFRQEFGPSIFSGALSFPSNVAGFLARHGIATDKTIRIEEYCIKPKNALFILGTLAPNPDADLTQPVRSALPPTQPSASPASNQPARAASAPEIIRLSDGGHPTSLAAMSQQEKVAAALTRAGITNPAAWSVAETEYPGVTGRAAAIATSSASAPAPALDPSWDLHSTTMLTKGRNDSALLISWRSQREVVQSLGWKSTLMIWGGPALALVSLYIVLAHLGWL